MLDSVWHCEVFILDLYPCPLAQASNHKQQSDGEACVAYIFNKTMVTVAILEGKLYLSYGELSSNMAAITMEFPWCDITRKASTVA